jgi:hypothetical protein
MEENKVKGKSGALMLLLPPPSDSRTLFEW